MSADKALAVRGLQMRYGALHVLDGLDFDARAGRVTALIGPNGAGKSTAFACIAGAVRATAGSVKLFGREVTGVPAYAIARLGLVRTYQIVQTFADMTVLEAVTVGALLRHPRLSVAREAALRVLERVGLAQRARVLGKALTIADKKRLELARALAAEPRVLLLDEVLAGLTPAEGQAAVELVRGIASDGTSIVMVEHVMETLMPLADHVIVLSAGRCIFDGPAAAALVDPAVIEAYLGRP
jgi:branched-chain amino acid transport system ATP-binding protein